MTAVSSFRPLNQSKEVADNQKRAIASWDAVFDKIVLVGQREPELETAKTQFVCLEDFPTISAMCLVAHISGDWAAILNADIVVSTFLPAIVEKAKRRKAWAMTSRRYEFEPAKNNLASARVIDNGFDFFLANQSMWLGAARAVPKTYRIGHNAWDSWLLGYFNTVAKRHFVDITRHRCIFHPRHQERKRAYAIDMVQDKYTAQAHPPFLKL